VWAQVKQPSWEFGDGSTASGRGATHTYSTPGGYEVSVSAFDSVGHRSRVVRQVVIRRAIPVRNVQRPRVVGTARVKRAVVCLPGKWLGTQPIQYSYAWRVDGQVVRRDQRLTIREPYRDSLMACVVTAHNYAGSKAATSSGIRVG
jgi:hypothetical protein